MIGTGTPLQEYVRVQSMVGLLVSVVGVVGVVVGVVSVEVKTKGPSGVGIFLYGVDANDVDEEDVDVGCVVLGDIFGAGVCSL